MTAFPCQVDVRIEVPLGSLIKWRADRRIDFASPVPCPFNYGSVVGTVGPDGDPVDAVVLGPVLPRGRTARFTAWGRVDFVDAGVDDPKWLCAPEPPSERDWARVQRFFHLYGAAKSVLNRLRGESGWTGVRSVGGETP